MSCLGWASERGDGWWAVGWEGWEWLMCVEQGEGLDVSLSLSLPLSLKFDWGGGEAVVEVKGGVVVGCGL